MIWANNLKTKNGWKAVSYFSYIQINLNFKTANRRLFPPEKSKYSECELDHFVFN